MKVQCIISHDQVIYYVIIFRANNTCASKIASSNNNGNIVVSNANIENMSKSKKIKNTLANMVSDI